MSEHARSILRLQVILIGLILIITIIPRYLSRTEGGKLSTSDNEPKKVVSLASSAVSDGAVTKEGVRTLSSLGTLPNISAKSYVVWDVKANKVLFARDENDALPLASLTKMMSALVAREALNPDATVVISPEDLAMEGDSGFLPNESWTAHGLLDFSLVASSNDGMSAIATAAGRKLLDSPVASWATAQAAFVNEMNARARALGLRHTVFRNPTGLDIGGTETGGRGTARDVAMLFEYIMKNHPDLFTATTETTYKTTSLDKVVHHAENTNTIADRLPGLIGGKTGYTDLAGGNLTVLVDIGIDHPVIIAVLSSSREGRFSDVATLARSSVAAVAGVGG